MDCNTSNTSYRYHFHYSVSWLKVRTNSGINNLYKGSTRQNASHSKSHGATSKHLQHKNFLCWFFQFFVHLCWIWSRLRKRRSERLEQFIWQFVGTEPGLEIWGHHRFELKPIKCKSTKTRGTKKFPAEAWWDIVLAFWHLETVFCSKSLVWFWNSKLFFFWLIYLFVFVRSWNMDQLGL